MPRLFLGFFFSTSNALDGGARDVGAAVAGRERFCGALTGSEAEVEKVSVRLRMEYPC